MMESVDRRQGKTGAAQMLWRQVRQTLRSSLGERAFAEFLAPLELVEAEGGSEEGSEIRLRAPTGFLADWVNSNYADRILHLWRQSAQKHGSTALPVRVLVERPLVAAAPASGKARHQPQLDLPQPIAVKLDPRFSFKNFVVGQGNRLAASAAQNLVLPHKLNQGANQEAGKTPNPLFLHGGVGMGKTHLLQAIAHAAPGRVAFLSAARFRSLFVGALRRREGMVFKEWFRDLDMLLLDDVQFLTGQATGEEFLHHFDTLMGAGAKLVFSASKAPSHLDALDPRIRSRLGGGLVAELSASDYELRLKVLKSAMARRDPELLPQEILEFVARRVTHNVRELEGALFRLIHHAEHAAQKLTQKQAGEILRDLLGTHKHQITIAAIQKRVAKFYNITLEEMLSPRRQRQLVRPRQVAIFLAKSKTLASLPHIGRHFGNRDHTTVRYALQRIEALMAQDESLRAEIDMLDHELSQTYAERTV